MSTMTDEQLMIRIAEACGWKRSELWDYSLYGRISRNPNQIAVNRCPAYELDGFTKRLEELPNYPASLDAIQSAVLSMPVEFQLRFNDAFHKHFGRRFNGGFVQFTWQLTARDWCEAFVAALEP